MALIRGKFIDPTQVIKQSQDPSSGNDVSRKSYVDSKAAAEAAAAAAAAQSAAQSYADGKVQDSILDGVTNKAPSQNAVFDALALKQNSIGSGTTSQFLRGDLTWQTVPSQRPAKVLTVGIDANTIAGCIALATSPSANNNYIVEIPPGAYTEDLTIPGNVHLKGLANPNDSLSVKITGQHTITGTSNNALNNRVAIANILFTSSHATTPLFSISGTLAETEVQMTGCFLQNNNTASTAKLVNLGTFGKLYVNNTRSRMAGSSQGGTHFTVAAGASLYTQYGLDVDGGTCAIDMTGQGYAQLISANITANGASAIKIAASGLVLAQDTSITNGAAIGNGVNMTGANASFFATHCIFNIQDNAASYVVTGISGTYFGFFANSYSHIPGLVVRNTKIGASVAQLRYSNSLSTADISDFQTNVRAAAVADVINDGVTNIAPSQNAVFDALALKQNSLGTGTTSQYLRGDLTWQTISTSYPVGQMKYVAVSGNDSTGDGSEEKPYLTITGAMNAITDASPTKRYVVRVAAGNYTEASLALKANVFVVGESKESVRITGPVSLHSSFSGSADNRSGFSMVTLLSAADFNWATVTSAAGKLYMNEVQFGSTLNMYGYNNAIAQALFDSCTVFGNMTVSGINIGAYNNCNNFGNITLTQHPSGGMATILNATGGYCSGTITFKTTVNDFGRRAAGFLRGFNSENLIIDGPSSYSDCDLVSQGKSSTQKLNGGTLVAMNPRVNHDLETQMLKPLATNSHNLGDWGKQYMFNFAYVQGSTGTELYIISAMENYDPAGDTSGKPIYIQPDAYGLQTNVNGGDIWLQTASTSGTGVRGKAIVDARELDMTSAKITNLAAGSASTDAVNKGQLDSQIAATLKVPHKESKVLTNTDISNGYINMTRLAVAESTSVHFGGAELMETDDYTVSTVGGVTRITFSPAILLLMSAGDKVYTKYWSLT